MPLFGGYTAGAAETAGPSRHTFWVHHTTNLNLRPFDDKFSGPSCQWASPTSH